MTDDPRAIRDPNVVRGERLNARRTKLRDALARIYGFVTPNVDRAINECVQGSARDGQDHAYLLTTVRHDPPDPDRVKTPVRETPEMRDQHTKAWERAFGDDDAPHAFDCACDECQTVSRPPRRR